MENKKLGLLEWLCINPTFLRSKSVGGFVSAILLLTVLVTVPALLFHFAVALLGFGNFANDTARFDAIRNLGLVIAAVIGVPFIVWRSVVAQKQVDVAEQGHITDRINKAVDGLGAERTSKVVKEHPIYVRQLDRLILNDEGLPIPATDDNGTPIVQRDSFEQTLPNLEVRLGAIYSLERTAKDSPRDHLQIMEILCAYIRENARTQNLTLTETPSAISEPRTDIQAAITVIARRSTKQTELERQARFRLDLRGTDLSSTNFGGGDFAAALMMRCRLEAADFRGADLSATILSGSLLNYSAFHHAELRGTILDGCTLNKASSLNFFYGSKLSCVSVLGMDMSAIQFLPNNIANATFGCRDTLLSAKLEFDRGKLDILKYQIEDLEAAGNSVEAERLRIKLYSENRFVDWLPYSKNDGALPSAYKEMLERHGLTGWPYAE